MVTVPNICTDVPALSYNPVIAYLSDTFTRPYPFAPSVAIDIDDVVEKKLDMLHCHASQMYEWLPYNAGQIDQVPQGTAERRKWLEHRLDRFRAVADTSRDQLVERYGEEQGGKVEYAEAFELSEYGGGTKDRLAKLFPF